jgi:hypothetical protein
MIESTIMNGMILPNSSLNLFHVIKHFFCGSYICGVSPKLNMVLLHFISLFIGCTHLGGALLLVQKNLLLGLLHFSCKS